MTTEQSLQATQSADEFDPETPLLEDDDWFNLFDLELHPVEEDEDDDWFNLFDLELRPTEEDA